MHIYVIIDAYFEGSHSEMKDRIYQCERREYFSGKSKSSSRT